MKNHNNELGFGYVGILLVVLVLVLMGATGYFVYSRNSDKDTNSSISQKIDEVDELNRDELKKQETLTAYIYNAEDYVGWKEYCSKTEKACFNYPSDWILTDNNAGKEVNGVGEKITPDMENISFRSPESTQSSNKGFVEWNNFLSGLGGACVDEQNKLEILSYSEIDARPSDYVIEYTSKSSEDNVYYRLLNYDSQVPKIGLTDACLNTFYKFFKGKNISRDILFEASGTDQSSKNQAKKVVQSLRYQ